MTGRNLAKVMTLTAFSTCIIKSKKKPKQVKYTQDTKEEPRLVMRFKLTGIGVTRYPLAPQNFIYHSLRRVTVLELLSVKERLDDVYMAQKHYLQPNPNPLFYP